MASSPRVLNFRCNQSFELPLGMSQWAALFDLTQGEFRLQVRTTEDNPSVVYVFDNLSIAPYSNSPASAGQGVISYEPVTQILSIDTTYSEVKTFLSTPGTYVFDLQYTIRDVTGAVIFVRDLAFGTLVVTAGVTRS